MSTEDRSVMAADTGAPHGGRSPWYLAVWWEQRGPPWERGSGARPPRASGVCSVGARTRRPLGEVRRAEATKQFPWGRGGAVARGSPAPSELGTEWTLRIGDSRHLLRPEEHHSFLFMFIEGGILWFRFLIGGITNAVCFLL